MHLTDDRLIALYFADAEDSAETWVAMRQHLHGCESCTWRYAGLTAPLQQLRADAASEADEVFTDARLETQRVAIAERLDSGARGSRVVQFPGSSVRSFPRHGNRTAVRWISAAAAAGLIVGLSVGRMVFPTGVSAPHGTAARAVTAVPAATTTQPVSYQLSSQDREEAFLHDLLAASERHSIPELRALDELTPRAREAVMASLR